MRPQQIKSGYCSTCKFHTERGREGLKRGIFEKEATVKDESWEGFHKTGCGEGGPGLKVCYCMLLYVLSQSTAEVVDPT